MEDEICIYNTNIDANHQRKKGSLPREQVDNQ